MSSGAGNEVRTRDPNHGKVMLYQLSYSRVHQTGANYNDIFRPCKHFLQKFCGDLRKGLFMGFIADIVLRKGGKGGLYML